MESGYRWAGDDLMVALAVQPRAGADQWLGRHGERLRVRIAAPPAHGKANARLCAFLAELFQVPTTAVTLLSGAGGRTKRLRIRSPRRLPPGIAPPPQAAVAPGKHTR